MLPNVSAVQDGNEWNDNLILRFKYCVRRFLTNINFDSLSSAILGAIKRNIATRRVASVSKAHNAQCVRALNCLPLTIFEVNGNP